MKPAEVPELSERYTTLIAFVGTAEPLSVVMSASAQSVIAPEKIFAIVVAESFRVPEYPECLYMIETGPAIIGTYVKSAGGVSDDP